MTSPQREQPHSQKIHVASQSAKERLDLERKILAAAFKYCFEHADREGAAYAHRGLCAIIQQQLYSGDGSSGSVIPASVWEQAKLEEEKALAAPATQPMAEILIDAPPVHVPPIPEHQVIEAPHLTAAELAELNQADPTAPLNYLDFGDDPAQTSAPVPPAAQLSPSQAIKTRTMYQILGVSQVASFEEIHQKFLRLMRRMLQNRYAAETSITDMREFRDVLRAVCVAHDILKDPITRTDYDLRQVGLRGDEPLDENKPLTERTQLKLGELLECADVLEPAELQAALDMHKAEPGVQFGEFLVSAGFLNETLLDCALLAQRLISSGKITVNQYRTGMYRLRDDGTAFFDTLMMEGWLSPADIFDPSSDLWGSASETGGNAEAPAVVPAEWNDVPEELRQPAEDAKDNGNGALHADENHADEKDEQQPAGVASSKDWTERDALAETQAIDVSAFRTHVVADED